MKILSFGEVMMRLTPPEYKMVEQTDSLNLSFTGTGVNVLSGLAHFGYQTNLLTRLPDNHVGKAATGFMRRLGIDDKEIIYGGNHIGVYFLEMGYGVRPSHVTYLNRLNSSFGESTLADYELERIVDSYDIVHICGISLSLGDGPRMTAIKLARLAYEKNKTVCFDFNYRPSLNQNHSLEWIRNQYETILPYCTIVFGGERDLLELLNFHGDSFNQIAEEFLMKYDLKYFAGTRRNKKKNEKFQSGFIFSRDEVVESAEKLLEIYDRIGAGDAFVAGIITGIIENWDLQKTIDFAIASAVLAHTTFSDSPVIDREMVEKLADDNLGDVIR